MQLHAHTDPNNTDRMHKILTLYTNTLPIRKAHVPVVVSWKKERRHPGLQNLLCGSCINHRLPLKKVPEPNQYHKLYFSWLSQQYCSRPQSFWTNVNRW